MEALIARDGVLGFRNSIEARKACCHVRKVVPLKRPLAGAAGWVTGLRRGQSGGRADVPFAAWDEEFKLVKLNPIADWPLEKLEAYVEEHAIPVNPLHARGFPSIGCAPCTRAIQPGEDIRAGRWWWESDWGRECGLHNRPDRKAAAPAAHPSHLDFLSPSIYIFREAAAQFRKPVLLYSIGKDSTVLLHLARKAFWPPSRRSRCSTSTPGGSRAR